MEQQTASTYDADTGETVQPPPVQPYPMRNGYTVPSLINIPPQVAVTVFWVAVGFGLCWWMTGQKGNRGNHSFF
jgi:hypothetical protein